MRDKQWTDLKHDHEVFNTLLNSPTKAIATGIAKIAVYETCDYKQLSVLPHGITGTSRELLSYLRLLPLPVHGCQWLDVSSSLLTLNYPSSLYGVPILQCFCDSLIHGLLD